MDDYGVMTQHNRKYEILVAVGMAVYAVVLGLICHLKFRNYLDTDFDLAIHAQSVWSILQGSTDSSILGIPFLGNHMVLILFLVAPLYAIFPSPLLLLYLQAAILALGAWGIFKLAQRELSERWSLAFAFIYLTYPPLIYMNLYEFHPIALATSFLIFALYGYRRERFGVFCKSLSLALLCQENVALIVAAFGVYALVDRRKGKWIWIPMAAGVLYFVVTVVFVMPRLNPYVQLYSMYSHLGQSFPDVVKNVAMHPSLIVDGVWNGQRLTFLNLLLAPLGYLSLLSPCSLIPSLPVLFQRLLSTRATETALIYHYQAEFIPFVFAAAILGVHRLLGNRGARLRRLLAASLLTVFPVLAFLATVLIPGFDLVTQYRARDEFLVMRKRALLQQIPSHAAVAATFEFLPTLANRRDLYSLHHVYSGRYTLSTIPYPVPPRLDYVVLNTRDRLTFLSPAFYQPAHYKHLQALLTNGTWVIADNVDCFLAFRRTSSSGSGVRALVQLLESIPDMNRNVTQTGSTGLRLVGFCMGNPDANNIVPLTLYWQKVGTADTDVDVALTIVGTQTLYSGILSPGSRLWPPQSWPADGIVADSHRIHLTHHSRDLDKVSIKATLIPLDSGARNSL